MLTYSFIHIYCSCVSAGDALLVAAATAPDSDQRELSQIICKIIVTNTILIHICDLGILQTAG